MPTASDIITYTGIPLAVLGVLPIFYTTLRSLLTLRSIRRRLSLCKLEPLAIRGSLISGIIEVTLPRVAIVPLDREDRRCWEVNGDSAVFMGGGGDGAREGGPGKSESRVSSWASWGMGKGKWSRKRGSEFELEEGDQLMFSKAMTRSNTQHHHNPHRPLRGGAYTLFHWRTLITGSKLSRVQYTDGVEEGDAEEEEEG